MRKSIILFTAVCLSLLFCAPPTIGREFRIKGNHRPATHKKGALNQGKSLKVIKTNKTEEFNADVGMLLKQKAGSAKLRKDLVSKARISSHEGFQGKTKEELILSLNSENVLPCEADSNINGDFPANDLSFSDSLLNVITFLGFPAMSSNSISMLNLLAFTDLSKVSSDPYSIAHVAARVGLTVLFWGTPVFSVAGSAALTFAFNQNMDHKQDIKYQQEKRDDKIYKDIYKYCACKEEYKLSSFDLGISIDVINERDISTSEFQNRVSQSYSSQHSLAMLESRFAGLGPVQE